MVETTVLPQTSGENNFYLIRFGKKFWKYTYLFYSLPTRHLLTPTQHNKKLIIINY